MRVFHLQCLEIKFRSKDKITTLKNAKQENLSKIINSTDIRAIIYIIASGRDTT